MDVTTNFGNVDTDFFSGSASQTCKVMCKDRNNPRRCTRRCLAGMPDEDTPATASDTNPVQTTATGQATQYDPTTQAAQTYEQLGGSVGQAMVKAPEGTYAASLGNVTGVPLAANDPNALYENYFAKTYGTQPGSASQQLALQYLNPQEKVLGIMGHNPELDVDAVNFGAQLLETVGGGMGGQLSPHYMITNIVNGVMNASSGGGMDASDVNADPFSQIAKDPNPYNGIRTLMSILRGALTGTMPDDSLNAYLFNLEMYAHQQVSGAGGFMDTPLTGVAEQEGQGVNWFTKMVQSLGPTLGL
jgi:hypothetical protein